MNDFSSLVLPGLQIVWINILLSGDNAVVIALACQSLEARRRRWAIVGGASVAVALRLGFTFFIVELLRVPFVKLASGLLLLWIAVDLLRRGGSGKDVTPSSSVWGAIRTIALADAIMSLDNVVAVAAAARNSIPLIIFGVGLSVPLIVFGSTLVLRLLERVPLLVVAGAALLGWVAGEMIASEPEIASWIGAPMPERADVIAAVAGAALILAIAGVSFVLRARKERLAV